MINIAYSEYINIIFRNPNLPSQQDSVHGGRVKNRFDQLDWPKYTLDKQEYMHIGRCHMDK